MGSLIFFTKTVSIVGGKEKVLAGLANYLYSQGYNVQIITYDGNTNSVFPLHDGITLKTIPARSITPGNNFKEKIVKLSADIKAYKNLNGNIKDVNYLIATDYLIAAIIFFAFRKSSKKIIIWEHLTYSVSTSVFWKFIRKKIYSGINSLVALNKEEAEFYKKIGCIVHNIPNPIAQQKVLESKHQRKFIWVGSLIKEKGVDDLVSLAEKLKKEKTATPVHVYGEGPEKINLTKAIAAKGLEEILILKGVENITENIYRNATALIIVSQHECFPTVILEAFSFGVPVIAFNCPTGPRNLITEGEDGFLIAQGNIFAMHKKMMLLINEDDLFSKMSKNAFAASRNYDPEIIYPSWKKILT